MYLINLLSDNIYLMLRGNRNSSFLFFFFLSNRECISLLPVSMLFYSVRGVKGQYPANIYRGCDRCPAAKYLRYQIKKFYEYNSE